MTERTLKIAIRAKCVDRDGFCRIGRNLIAAMGPCRGASEWAHLGESRRFKTRGMAPEVRHTIQGTAMLCSGHHSEYDGHRLDIELLTPLGANGPLAFEREGRRFVEESYPFHAA